MVGLAIAALVLLLTFGSIVAAGLPLATALFGLGISGALIGLLAAVLDVPDWAPALASMLGIGVGIDYALLIVTRYRAALAAGRDAARGGCRGGRDRRPLGADRRDDRRDLAARAVPDGPPLPLRRGARDDRRGARRDGGVGHARAGAAGDRRARGSTACTSRAPAARRGRRRRDARGALGPRGPAPAVGRRDRRRRRAAGARVAVRRACGSASPTAATTRRTRRRGRPTTWSRSGFGPGANGPLLLVAPTAGEGDRDAMAALAERAARRARRRGGRRAGDEPARRRDGAERDPGARSPQDAATEDLSTHLRDDVLPGAGAAGEPRRRDRRVHGPEPGDGRPAAAVHRRRRRALVPAAAGQLPLGRRRAEGGRDEPALDRAPPTASSRTWPRAAGPGSWSGSTPRRRCRRSSR